MQLRPGNEEKPEESGPWGVLKRDAQPKSWRSRVKQRLGRINQALLFRPGSTWLQVWNYVCAFTAVLSGWEVPFHFAFYEPGALMKPYDDWVAIVEYIAAVVFVLDFLSKFCIAYIDAESGVLVTNRLKIAKTYVTSWRFPLDFMGWFPLDWIITDNLADRGASASLLYGLAWIKLLQLARMYRLFELFADLDYRMVLSQGVLLLTRNYTYVFYVTHWAACILYHIASHQHYSPNSWVGRNAERFRDQPVDKKYLLALYFSVSAFTGLGDGALFASTLPEAAFMIIYLLFNLFLSAYILGTVTMLVVKGDERSKHFRDRMSNLEEFSKNNELPDRLQGAMHEHLEVTFNTEQLDDERVLGIYPTTIRRKVLRHLYLQPIRDCYLFRGCKQRFLDAFLTAARVELFMPAVQLMIEGDNVTELNIIVSGEVMVAEAGINISAAFAQFAATDAGGGGGGGSRRWASSDGGAAGAVAKRTASMNISRNASLNRTASMSRTASMNRVTSVGRGSMTGSIKDFLLDGAAGFSELATGRKVVTRYSSDALAEVPFFTDVPSNETIMTQTVVRVLSLPKAAWESLMQQFPQQARLVLANLLNHAELELAEELHEAADASGLGEEQLRTGLQQIKDKRAAERGDTELAGLMHDTLSQTQIDLLTKLDDVRAVVRAHVRKVDQLRTFEFLGCASDGSIETLRIMLNQGISPNSADYDGRTGLMLAAAAGHEAVVRLLLDSGAKSDQLDAFGNSAMAEAVKNAHDDVIDVLLSYGGTLGMEAMAVASVMCTAVFEGDLVKLRRLLRSGAPPDACDYDKRSALHIAGAEGNLAAVKLLVEEGGADPNFQDRWGNTALDEARRVGATPVVSYLEGLLGAEQLVGSAQRYRQQVAFDFLSACSTGDVARVRYITHNSQPACIFTGLVMAASKGYTDVVELLLAWVPNDLLMSEGHMALVEAARMGHCQVVAALRTCGMTLADPRDATLLAHMRAAVQSVDLRAVAAMLAAGVDVKAESYGNGTLLHAAASTGSLELVRRLVEDGSIKPGVEDPTGKTPAAIAEGAKLAAVADYLRWAASVAAAPGAGAGAGADTAAGALAAAAAARFGPLPDYSVNETHEEATHGVMAPEGRTAVDQDEDDDGLPSILAKMGSSLGPNGVPSPSPNADPNAEPRRSPSPSSKLTLNPSARKTLTLASLTRTASPSPTLPRQGSLRNDQWLSRQGSFLMSRQGSAPRGSALTRLASAARMAGDVSGEVDASSHTTPSRFNRNRRTSMTARTSLTGFLRSHRAEDAGADTNGDNDPLLAFSSGSNAKGTTTGGASAAGSVHAGSAHAVSRLGSVRAAGYVGSMRMPSRAASSGQPNGAMPASLQDEDREEWDARDQDCAPVGRASRGRQEAPGGAAGPAGEGVVSRASSQVLLQQLYRSDPATAAGLPRTASYIARHGDVGAMSAAALAAAAAAAVGRGGGGGGGNGGTAGGQATGRGRAGGEEADQEDPSIGLEKFLDNPSMLPV